MLQSNALFIALLKRGSTGGVPVGPGPPPPDDIIDTYDITIGGKVLTIGGQHVSLHPVIGATVMTLGGDPLTIGGVQVTLGDIVVPVTPAETFDLVDQDGNSWVDSDGNHLVWFTA